MNLVAQDLPAAPARLAPLQVEAQFRLDVPAEEAFDLVVNRLGEWFASIRGVTWDHARSHGGPRALGACSQRTCNFDGKALIEDILEVEPGRRYVYSVDMDRSELKMPLRNHRGSFEVQPRGTTGCVVVWRQHFDARWFVPAAVLRWQMRDKMMRPALEKLVELCGGELVSLR
jgi:uncharacterized protein YndB with AHSA1/START domain